jgi:hypothetical protein
MSRKTLSLVLIGLILNLTFYSTALANPEKGAKLQAKVKAGIIKLGTGTQSVVKVKLHDKTIVKGYVSEVSDESFTVVNENTQSVIKVPYSGVKQISGKNNLSGKTIIAIGIWVALITLIAIRGV